MERVACPENAELVAFMSNKRKELAESSKGLLENHEKTLSKAYFNVCNSKTPIKTLKDFSDVKGVGKWILKLMKDFFVTNPNVSQNEERTQKDDKKKGNRRYLPQKNSVAYALLITLYRGIIGGSEFMRKQELIDAAEASGLSRSPIMPEIGKGKAGQFGVSSAREWYSGWSCMGKLIDKGLVVKSSCPAKYMITERGKEAAHDCLLRSGLVDSTEVIANAEKNSSLQQCIMEDPECTSVSSVEEITFQHVSSSRQKKSVDIPSDTLNKARASSAEEITYQHVSSSRQKKSVDIPPDTLNKLVRMGYSKEQVFRAFSEVSEASPNEEISSLWISVLCRLREYEVYDSPMESQNVRKRKHHQLSSCNKHEDGQADPYRNETGLVNLGSEQRDEIPTSSMRACSSTDHNVLKRGRGCMEVRSNVLAMPPLFGDRFEDAYEVVLVLDDREKFAKGSRSRNLLEQVKREFKISIEVRRLPVGDAIWIARHKQLGTEYVLDFIVERKNVDDLRMSIRDNRYKDQKVRILRSGLKKVIYLVEGDPNACQGAESIKTACLTTEILEGFDVQRTSGLGETLRKYCHLTHSITKYYSSLGPEDKREDTPVCPPYDEFITRCQELDKMTVSDLFATQLMQVPQVTEDVAIAVVDMYPTVFALANAYLSLDGDLHAQEELLKKQSNNAVNGAASRNIFKFIWGG